MKTPTISNPKARIDDTDEMRGAIHALNAEGIGFSRPTAYQLKVGDLSYYPGTGRIFRDGDAKAWEQRDFITLISYLREKRNAAGSRPPTTPATNRFELEAPSDPQSAALSWSQ